jgi:translation initiation factor 2 subunit 1
MVRIVKIADISCYVELLEYNNIEGMILFSELSRRRIRSLNKVVRVGRTEVLQVLRVDRERGYIDLSKKNVSPDDIEATKARYADSRTVHSIMRHVAQTVGKTPLELYEEFGWDLYERFPHALEGFKTAVVDPETVFGRYNLSPEVQELLLTNIRRKMAPAPVRLRGDFEVTCYTEAGVDAVKAALRKGLTLSTEEIPLKIRLIVPPEFIISAQTMYRDRGLTLMNETLNAIRQEIERYGGALLVKQEPRLVSDKDEAVLADRMVELEAQAGADDEGSDM